MTLSFPTSGSGNMVPIPMNEFLQKNLASVGVKVNLQPIEWASMLNYFFNRQDPRRCGCHQHLPGYVLPSLLVLMVRVFLSHQRRWLQERHRGQLAQGSSSASSTRPKRAAMFEQINASCLKDAPWLIVCNDLNPRVLGTKSPRTSSCPQSWYVDLTTTSVS